MRNISVSAFLLQLHFLALLFVAPTPVHAQFNPRLYNIIPDLQLSTLSPPINSGELRTIKLVAWTTRGWVNIKMGSNVELGLDSGTGEVVLNVIIPAPPPVTVPVPVIPPPVVLISVNWVPDMVIPVPPMFVFWNGLSVFLGPDYTLAPVPLPGSGYTLTPNRPLRDIDKLVVFYWQPQRV